MDFLFASQDASTASLTWTLTLLADHPDVLQKARQRFPPPTQPRQPQRRPRLLRNAI